MAGPTITLIITDLDDTLYDWTAAVIPALRAMLAAAAALLGVEEQRLASELQQVHRKHADSEWPWALFETGAVQWRFGPIPRRDLERHLAPALHAFKLARQTNLAPHPGVLAGLEQLQRARVAVVGHSEGRISNALYRLNRLGLKPLLSGLYMAEPGGRTAEPVPPTNGFLRLLPARLRRPDARLLGEICRRHEVDPGQALFIGDHPRHDAAMARQAGLHFVWARYGNDSRLRQWPDSLALTHWSEAESDNEERARRSVDATTAAAAVERFDELLQRFEFRPSYTRGEWWGLTAPGNTM